MKKLWIALVIAACLFSVSCHKGTKDPELGQKEVRNTTITTETAISTTVASILEQANGVSIPSINLVKKKNKVRYLLTNGIEVTNEVRNIGTSKGGVEYYIPKVSGLVNKNVEEKLNKKIIEECEKEVKNYVNEAGEKNFMIGFESTINANNLIAFKLSGYNISPQMGFLFRLTDGERLRLKDVFTPGTNYVDLLKEQCLRQILYNRGEDDYMQARSRLEISQDQEFALSETSLDIIFPFDKNRVQAKDERDLRDSVSIPLQDIDDYVQVMDLYSGTERTTHERLEFIERRNNVILIERGKTYNKNNGKIFSQYRELVGLKDKSFQEKFNNILEKGLKEILDGGYLDSQKRDANSGMEQVASVGMNVRFNHYGYLTIIREVYGSNDTMNLYSSLYKIYSFDLVKNKQIEIKDLLLNYLKDKPEIQRKFTELINTSLSEMAKISPVNYKDIVNNGMIYFSKDGDIQINVYIKANDLKNQNPVMIGFCLFKDIVKLTPEEFFGN